MHCIDVKGYNNNNNTKGIRKWGIFGSMPNFKAQKCQNKKEGCLLFLGYMQHLFKPKKLDFLEIHSILIPCYT